MAGGVVWHGRNPAAHLAFCICLRWRPPVVAAIAAFRARDGVAVAVHTAWGSFWIGWGILQLLTAAHVLAPIAAGSANSSFAFWFLALTLVTTTAFIASIAQSAALAGALGTLSAGSALTAAGFYAGNLGVQQTGGVLFVISAALAWFTASA